MFLLGLVVAVFLGIATTVNFGTVQTQQVEADSFVLDIAEVEEKLARLEVEATKLEKELGVKQQIINAFLENKQPAYHGLLLYERSLEYGVDPKLALAVIVAESNVNPSATNNNANGTSDRGYFQINDGTGPWLAEQLGIENYSHDMAYDPEVNIEMGTYFLGYLSKKYPDQDHVLTAYNRGEGGARELERRTGSVASRYSQEVRNIMQKD